MFSKALAKIDLLTDTNPVFRTIMRDMKEMIAATYRDSRKGVQFQNRLAQTHILLRHAAGPAYKLLDQAGYKVVLEKFEQNLKFEQKQG